MTEIRGYYDWTWKKTTPPEGTNLSIAFSGWARIEEATQQSGAVFSKLVGDKFIGLGGGNNNGRFTADFLAEVTTAAGDGTFSRYQGIAFDVEVADSGLAQSFSKAFAACRTAGFKVLVTVSHSRPYDCEDGVSLMTSFFNDPAINYLSPQLYTSGRETSNDYTQGTGVSWQDWTNTRTPILPSIVDASLYPSAVDYFNNLGITLSGYIQWKQTSSIQANHSMTTRKEHHLI